MSEFETQRTIDDVKNELGIPAGITRDEEILQVHAILQRTFGNTSHLVKKLTTIPQSEYTNSRLSLLEAITLDVITLENINPGFCEVYYRLLENETEIQEPEDSLSPAVSKLRGRVANGVPLTPELILEAIQAHQGA